jgi:c-di-GMP-related signal transduction protein
MDAFVARQPILDRHKKTYGYELLFRDGTARYVPGIDGDVATATVLSNSFFSIGMDDLLGGHRSFINFTRNLLLQKVPLILPIKTTIVEILEDVVPTPEVVAACREISERGYLLALDDFTYTDAMRPLIEIADIIKIDFRLTPPADIHNYVAQLPRREGLKLLAEKVETLEEFENALGMGFELFQGYFFCKPELFKGHTIPASQLTLMQIVTEVNQPDFNFNRLEQIISPDVSIAYKLLRYINSAFFATTQRISSIKQALVLLGEAELRRFVSLIALSTLARGKPNELIRAACIRGKFCEFVGSIARTSVSAGELFTLGIFSLIDAIVDQPMDQVMKNLPLSEIIKSALIERKGELTGFLLLAETYEKGQWEYMAKIAEVINVSQEKLPQLYRQACAWSNTLLDKS